MTAWKEFWIEASFTILVWTLCTIIVAGIGYLPEAHADHEDVVHAMAHIGTAYAGTTLCYGITKKFVSRLFTLPVCGSLVMLAGVAYDNTEPQKGASTLRNAIGVGAAVGSVLVFDF